MSSLRREPGAGAWFLPGGIIYELCVLRGFYANLFFRFREFIRRIPGLFSLQHYSGFDSAYTVFLSVGEKILVGDIYLSSASGGTLRTRCGSQTLRNKSLPQFSFRTFFEK